MKSSEMNKRKIGAGIVGAAAAVGAGALALKKNPNAIGNIKRGIGNARAGAMRAGYTAADKVGGAAKAGMRNVRNTAGQIGGTATLGKMAAGDAINSARQKVGNKLDSIGQGMERRGGYDQVNARTSGGSFKQKLNGTRAGEKMASRGAALRKTAARIRGN